jgi:hypothetical protein
MQHVMKGLVRICEVLYSLFENVLRQKCEMKNCGSFSGLK